MNCCDCCTAEYRCGEIVQGGPIIIRPCMGSGERRCQLVRRRARTEVGSGMAGICLGPSVFHVDWSRSALTCAVGLPRRSCLTIPHQSYITLVLYLLIVRYSTSPSR